MRNNV